MLHRATVVVCIAMLSVSQARAEDDLRQALAACMDISRDTSRLACFDRLAAPPAPTDQIVEQPSEPDVRSQQEEAHSLEQPADPAARPADEQEAAAQRAPESVASPSAPRANDDEEDFGLEHRKVRERQFESRVSSTEKGNFGRLIVHLENGQVWRQVDSKRLVLRRGQAVTVTRGVMNSFFLGATDGRNRVRVKRSR